MRITADEYAAIQQEILAAIDQYADELIATSRDIHAHPELMFQEHYAHALLTGKLEALGFEVQRGAGGWETAFTAYSEGQQRDNAPTVAIIAEYDALPNGHSCGHNLIATSALGAGYALNRVMHRLPGQVVVVGTPAEEGGGGKVKLRDAGVFQGIDCAMMTHMGMENLRRPVFLAVTGVEMRFHGRPAHSAASPEAGINALDAVIQTFNSINALRQHIRSDARIHGIITNGGQAVNIVPELAVCQFGVRARESQYVHELVQKVRLCAEGAASATGARLEFKELGHVEEVKSNVILSDLYDSKLRHFGFTSAIQQKEGAASTDMGALSYYLPAIHPVIEIADASVTWHTDEFREAAWSDRGQAGMILAAKCMALTTLDLLVKPELMDAVKAEFSGS